MQYQTETFERKSHGSNGFQLELAGLKRDWIDEVMPQFLLLAPSLGDFTTDDLHGVLPRPQEDNWWGVFMARLRNSGRIIYVRHQPSTRPSANGRKVAVWRFNDLPSRCRTSYNSNTTQASPPNANSTAPAREASTSCSST